MFGIGASELVLIGLVLIIFIRPEDLPAFLRKAGRAWGKIRREINELMEFKDAFMKQVDAVAKLEEEKDKASAQAQAAPDAQTAPDAQASPVSPAPVGSEAGQGGGTQSEAAEAGKAATRDAPSETGKP